MQIKKKINPRKAWENPIALEHEEVLFIQRKHWIVILPLLILLSIATCVILIGLNIASAFLEADVLIHIIFSLLLISICSTFLLKVITEWYFSFYVLTNRRLLEICYTPLTSYILNDVLLDQVRCTEIDTATHGLLFKYLDIGDITITFDRPTHQEAFTMSSIKNFHTLSRDLCNLLLPPMQPRQNASENIKQNQKMIWYKSNKDNKFTNLYESDPTNKIITYSK